MTRQLTTAVKQTATARLTVKNLQRTNIGHRNPMEISLVITGPPYEGEQASTGWDHCGYNC